MKIDSPIAFPKAAATTIQLDEAMSAPDTCVQGSKTFPRRSDANDVRRAAQDVANRHGVTVGDVRVSSAPGDRIVGTVSFCGSVGDAARAARAF